jgi:hypothetical protein
MKDEDVKELIREVHEEESDLQIIGCSVWSRSILVSKLEPVQGKFTVKRDVKKAFDLSKDSLAALIKTEKY